LTCFRQSFGKESRREPGDILPPFYGDILRIRAIGRNGKRDVQPFSSRFMSNMAADGRM
jgi:hypothetical protein